MGTAGNNRRTNQRFSGVFRHERPSEMADVYKRQPLGVRAGVAANIFTVAINSGPLPDEELSRCV